jgi:TPP-dependent pyruvate/acetoin dehydrogenase alpha subunit
MFAELFGRIDGYCRGKGGSMHIADPNIGVLGANGIVGAGLPIATGAALSARLRRSGQVSVCFFGDGAAAQGTFHESLNMASLWSLPVIYVCHNNRWAQSVPVRQELKVENVASMAGSYDIPGVAVDGQDVLAVYDATRKAVGRARGGEGPTLIEAKTYRWHGHHIGDADTYRSKEEIAEARRHDPIGRLKEHLLNSGAAVAGEIQGIETSALAEIDAGVQFAQASAEPPLEETLKNVYVGIEVIR